MFTPSDLQQLEQRHISLEVAEQQLQSFKNGFPALDIVAPASTKDGILRPSVAERERYAQVWKDYLAEGHSVLKFVPASGAA